MLVKISQWSQTPAVADGSRQSLDIIDRELGTDKINAISWLEMMLADIRCVQGDRVYRQPSDDQEPDLRSNVNHYAGGAPKDLMFSAHYCADQHRNLVPFHTFRKDGRLPANRCLDRRQDRRGGIVLLLLTAAAIFIIANFGLTTLKWSRAYLSKRAFAHMTASTWRAY